MMLLFKYRRPSLLQRLHFTDVIIAYIVTAFEENIWIMLLQ